MRAGPTKARVKVEQWVRPGEGQTVEELVARFAGRILRVENGEVLISVSEEVHDLG